MSTPRKFTGPLRRAADWLRLGRLEDFERSAAVKVMVAAFLTVFGGVGFILSAEPFTGTALSRFGFAALMGLMWLLLMVAVKRAPSAPANLAWAVVACVIWQFKSGVI